MPQPAPVQLGHLIVITARPALALRTQLALLSTSRRVEVVTTLRRGLAILRHRPPDAILLDRAVAIEPLAEVHTLVASARAAQVPLILVGDAAAAEPALLEIELGGQAIVAPASPLVAWLRGHGLHADGAVEHLGHRNRAG